MKKLFTILLSGMFLSMSLLGQSDSASIEAYCQYLLTGKKIQYDKGRLFIEYDTIVIESLFQQKKAKYNYKNYIWQPGDRYNPAIAGVYSFFIPGLGQIVSGESERGIMFFLGYTISSTIWYSSLISYAKNIYLEENDSKQLRRKQIAITSGIAVTSIWIISIIDASNCAKINNLYYRDKYKTSIKPDINFLQSDISYGLSLKFNF